MKIHPLLRLVVSEPHLISAHVHAYMDLLRAEFGKLSSALVLRIGLFAGAAVLGVLGILLVGVALLLRATVPSTDYPAGWALVVVPLVPLVAAAIMVMIARSKPVDSGLSTLKQQMNADKAMLREASAP